MQSITSINVDTARQGHIEWGTEGKCKAKGSAGTEGIMGIALPPKLICCLLLQFAWISVVMRLIFGSQYTRKLIHVDDAGEYIPRGGVGGAAIGRQEAAGDLPSTGLWLCGRSASVEAIKFNEFVIFGNRYTSVQLTTNVFTNLTIGYFINYLSGIIFCWLAYFPINNFCTARLIIEYLVYA